MFKKAVDAHSGRTGGPNGAASNAFKPVVPRLGSTPRNEPLRPKSRFVLNEPSGVKRSADGVAKSSFSASSDQSGPSSRSESGAKSVQGSQQAPIQVDRYQSISAKSNNVFFDDNDFDDDDDSLLLAAEDLSKKSTVSYPKLPTPPPQATVTYPQLKRDFHTQASASPIEVSPPDCKAGAQSFESEPLPWSSSPAEHFRSPKRSRFFDPPARSQAFKPATITAFVKNAADVKSQPRPATSAEPPKRRGKLPWAKTEEQQEDLLQTPQRAKDVDAQDRSNGLALPWNATASAMKEQQKAFRKANAKKMQTNLIEDAMAGSSNSSNKGINAKLLSSKSKGVARTLLSEEQKRVLDLVVEDGNSVFFTGSAGTGKSVLLREMIAALKKKFRGEGDRVAVTASTGLAACNIGGVTLHSFSGIGLGKESIEDLTKKVKRNQKAKQRWMRTKYLVIDEVSMVDGELFDKLEELARRIRNNARPFGGIKLVVTGDFFQLPPVAERGGASKFSFEASSWSTAIDHIIALKTVFRQKDPVFASMLNEMREGRLSQSTVSAFRKLARALPDSDDLAATELFPTRGEVENANSNRMSLLHGKSYTYNARDGGTMADKTQRDRLLQNCMAPETLELKKGAQVMLIKNIDETLVNGSLGKVVGFMTEAQFDFDGGEIDSSGGNGGNDEALQRGAIHKGINPTMLAGTGQLWPKVRFAVADGTTRDLLVQLESWKVELPNGEVQASRSQVPLILAWALSIHKAQGQTLERVKVDLGKVFEKGQAYVALSRATSIAGLQVLNFQASKVFAHERVRDFYARLASAGDSA